MLIFLLFFSLLCFKGKGQNEQKQNNNKLTLLVFNSDPCQVSISISLWRNWGTTITHLKGTSEI